MSRISDSRSWITPKETKKLKKKKPKIMKKKPKNRGTKGEESVLTNLEQKFSWDQTRKEERKRKKKTLMKRVLKGTKKILKGTKKILKREKRRGHHEPYNTFQSSIYRTDEEKLMRRHAAKLRKTKPDHRKLKPKNLKKKHLRLHDYDKKGKRMNDKIEPWIKEIADHKNRIKKYNARASKQRKIELKNKKKRRQGTRKDLQTPSSKSRSTSFKKVNQDKNNGRLKDEHSRNRNKRKSRSGRETSTPTRKNKYRDINSRTTEIKRLKENNAGNYERDRNEKKEDQKGLEVLEKLEEYVRVENVLDIAENEIASPRSSRRASNISTRAVNGRSNHKNLRRDFDEKYRKAEKNTETGFMDSKKTENEFNKDTVGYIQSMLDTAYPYAAQTYSYVGDSVQPMKEYASRYVQETAYPYAEQTYAYVGESVQPLKRCAFEVSFRVFESFRYFLFGKRLGV